MRPARHGTWLGYGTDGCRCNRCRAAWRLYTRELRHRRGRRTWDDHVAALGGVTHGLRSTYAHGCRCEECREAERVYRAEYRARRRPI